MNFSFKKITAAILSSVMLFSMSTLSIFAVEEGIDTLQSSAKASSQTNYLNNQGEIAETELLQLPVGAVRPESWLENQMLLMKENITGLMKEHKNYNYSTSAWLNGTDGEAWEKGPYFARGLVAMAYVLDDEKLLSEGMEWVKAIIDSQTETGFFGPSSNTDTWARMPALNVIRDFYEGAENKDPSERTEDEQVYINKVIPFFEAYGRSPSTREIEGAIGKSHVTVQRYLVAMRERGEIEYDGHRSIVTEHIREMLDTSSVQMGSSIPCGALDDVIDNDIENIRLPKAITGEGEFFLLRARGESMINAEINDGDLVLIRKQPTANEGKIVAFLYDNEQTTLKRLRYKDDAIYLCPENDSMQPIVIKGEDRAKLRIQGVAVGIIKRIE